MECQKALAKITENTQPLLKNNMFKFSCPEIFQSILQKIFFMESE